MAEGLSWGDIRLVELAAPDKRRPALVLTRTEGVTYTVQVTHYFGGQSNFWAKIAAMSVLGSVPVFITVATLQRFLVRGISMGAVKG